MPIPLQSGVNMFGGVNWHRRPHRPVATILPQARPQGEMGGHSATGFGVTTGAGCRVVQAPKPDGDDIDEFQDFLFSQGVNFVVQ